MRKSSETSGMESRFESRALAKALLIAEDLANAARPLALTELSRLANLGKASALRLVRTLQEIGLVVQDPQTENYRLDGTWISLRDQLRVRHLRSVALPILRVSDRRDRGNDEPWFPVSRSYPGCSK